MPTNEERDAKREAAGSKLIAQLAAWSGELDDLVAGYLRAGASMHDPYRIRIDGLRSVHAAVQAKLTEFTSQEAASVPWGSFRAEIATEWHALEAGLKDPTKDATARPADNAPKRAAAKSTHVSSAAAR